MTRWWLLVGLFVAVTLFVEWDSVRATGATISQHYWRHATDGRHDAFDIALMIVIVGGIGAGLIAHLLPGVKWPGGRG